MTVEFGTPVQKVVYMKVPGDRSLVEIALAKYATAWGLTLTSIGEDPRSVFDDDGKLLGRQIRYSAHLSVVDPEKFQERWDAAETEGGGTDGNSPDSESRSHQAR